MDSIERDPSKDFWRGLIAPVNPARRRLMVGLTIMFLAVIGLADFLLGFEITLLVFYFVPISFAVVTLGWRFGVVIAVASVTTWIAGDVAAGAHYASQFVPEWNACIALVTYLVLIWLLSSLLALHRDMEERVRQRTAALTSEIAERVRLEKALLEIGERERRSIGRELHDSLGQHLTGTALTGQILYEKLQSRKDEDAEDAKKVVALVKAAIEQTRNLAKGLLLVEIEPEGLVKALHTLAATTSEQFRVACVFRFEGTVTLAESGSATHLFRIAQEAVRNAVRHGQARRVELVLSGGESGVTLRIRDDGTGLPPSARTSQGLGLRIMAHRAAIIGAKFSIESPDGGGTLVVCVLPLEPVIA
jgi:signal transduction histidine kinase